jgi:hypothetical protein
MLNNLTNFFNLIVGKKIKTIPADSDLIPLGTRDSRYDGSYQPTAIQFKDLASAIGEPSIVLTEGVVDPQVQATMTPVSGTITDAAGVVYSRYRVQGYAQLAGASSYAYLIGVVVGSDNIWRAREDSVVLATDTNIYDTVASAMSRSALVADTSGNLASVLTAFIADDNTISATDEHWFTLVMTAGITFETFVSIDFTIVVPQGTVIEFFN